MKEHEMNAAAEEISAYFREKDYDLTKPKDLKQALTLAVAAWRDYSHYASTLSGLIEKFDESVEHYDTVSWFNMSLAPGNVDNLVTEGKDALNTAVMAFDKLDARAKDHCVMTLKKALAAPAATQKAVLGRAYSIGQDELAACVEELF